MGKGGGEGEDSFGNALGDEYSFRLQVLTGLAEVKKEVSIFNANTEKQVTELFAQVRHIREGGCGLADTHKDHEERLRYVEREIVPMVLNPHTAVVSEGLVHSDPEPRARGNPRTRFSIGKWVKWEGFSSTDIIVILAVMVFGAITVINKVDEKKLKSIEETVTRLSAMRTEGK